MISNIDFEDIRPYNDNEINAALKRITLEPSFFEIINYLFPSTPRDAITSRINSISSVFEFQKKIMYPAFRTAIKKTSNGFTCTGFDNISYEDSYLFISNHRDIFLDSAILQMFLIEHNFKTTQTAIGNNLIVSSLVNDIARTNKMFTTIRNGTTSKEMYGSSKLLSAYIRHTITDKQTSVWISQRNGRTKDGDDKTHVGLLKMLSVSDNNGFIEDFRALNIVPVSISYEYEPCDALKVKELYLSQNSSYKKSRDEDIKSIVSGIKEQKGGIHLSVGMPINNELLTLNKIENNNDKIKQLALLIDNQIYKNYKLWKTNYIAADILSNETQYLGSEYTKEEKELFQEYIAKRLDSLLPTLHGLTDTKADITLLHEMFLKLYATPVYNTQKLLQNSYT